MTKSTVKSKISPRLVVSLGMFCAIAYAVMYLSKLIPISIAGFLTLDFKDIIIVICGFLFGPVPAAMVSVVVSFIEMLTISTTGPWGFLMNVLSTCAFACPAALIYKSRHSFKSAVSGLAAGILCMCAIMILWNWLVTPIYMGVPRPVVVSMLIPTFLPFNLLKGCINAAGAMLLYKPIVTALRKSRLVASRGPSGSVSPAPKKKLSIGVTLVSLFVLVSLILVLLVWAEVI